MADNARGKQVACGRCKTAIRVPGGAQRDPWDDPDFASPPPQQSRRRPRKRKSNTPKIIGYIAAGVCGLALLTAGIIAAVSLINSDSKDAEARSSETAKSKSEAVAENEKTVAANGFFAKPPADRRVVVSNENWQPDEQLLNELEPVQTVEDLSIRVPKGMRLRPKRPGDSYPYAGYWTRRSQPPYDMPPTTAERRAGKFEAITIVVNPANGWTADRIERETLTANQRTPPGYPREQGTKVERGHINDRPFIRKTSFIRLPNGSTIHSRSYYFVDSKGRLVDAVMVTPSAPDSPVYQEIETALRTISERTP